MLQNGCYVYYNFGDNYHLEFNQLKKKLISIFTPNNNLLFIAFLFCSIIFVMPILDPDFWWHLRLGELLLQNHHLIGKDPFTYTVFGKHWVEAEWLSELLFALLYKIGNLGFIVLFYVLVTLFGAWLIFRRIAINKYNAVVVSIALLLMAIGGIEVWGPRSQMFTFMGAALILYLAVRYLNTGDKIIWTIIPFFLVWSNFTSGFLIGFVFFGVLLLGAGVENLLYKNDWYRWKILLLIFFLSILIGMINPNGPGVIIYPFATQFSGAQQAFIIEWQSPNFHNPVLWCYEIVLISTLFLIIWNRKIHIYDLLLLGVVILMSLQSIRHVVLFMVVAIPIWTDQVQYFLENHNIFLKRIRFRTPLLSIVEIIISFFLIFILLSKLIVNMSYNPSSQFYKNSYPVCAANWLLKDPMILHIFNYYGDGGYYIYRLSQHGDKVFIMGDAALMGNAKIYQYEDVVQMKSNWQQILLSYHTDIIMYEKNTSFSDMLEHSPYWIKVYQDNHVDGFVYYQDKRVLKYISKNTECK